MWGEWKWLNWRKLQIGAFPAENHSGGGSGLHFSKKRVNKNAQTRIMFDKTAQWDWRKPDYKIMGFEWQEPTYHVRVYTHLTSWCDDVITLHAVQLGMGSLGTADLDESAVGRTNIGTAFMIKRRRERFCVLSEKLAGKQPSASQKSGLPGTC